MNFAAAQVAIDPHAIECSAIGALWLKGWKAGRIAAALRMEPQIIRESLAFIIEYPRRYEREIWNTLARLERRFPQGSRKMTA